MAPKYNFLNKLTPYFFVAPVVMVLGFTFLYPVLKGFELSFFDWTLGTPIESKEFIGWENFLWVLNDPALFNSIKVSIIFATVTVSVQLLLGLLLAFLLEKGMGPLLSIFRTVFVLPIMIAPVVVGLIWRYIFSANYGLIAQTYRLIGTEPKIWLGEPGLAMLAIIITNIWQWTPFMFILFAAGLQSLPQEPLQAAEIDGASPFKIIIYIKLPLLAPVIFVATILRLIDAFRSLEVMFIMTFGGPARATEVLSLHIYKTAFLSQRLGMAAVDSILLLIIIGLFTMLFLIISKPLLSEI